MPNLLLAFMAKFKIQAMLFLTVVVGLGYFYNGQGWNQNSRYDVIYSFVEPGFEESYTFAIDRWMYDAQLAPNTADWARSENSPHIYSNKAPGAQFLGIDAYFVIYYVERLVGLDPNEFRTAHVNAYLINLFATVGIVGLAAVLMFSWLPRILGLTNVQALIIALSTVFASLMFPFSTHLWGHTTAAALALIGSLLAFIAMKEHHQTQLMRFSGFVMGCAVLTEYSCAIMVIGLVFVFMSAQNRIRNTAYFILGGLIPLAIHGLYHYKLFGSPFTLATAHSNPFFQEEGLTWGFLGAFNTRNLLHLLFLQPRGLILFCPVFIFSIIGAFQLWKNGHRRLVIYCAACFILFVFVFASFIGWHGGNSSGPRYLIPALPLLSLLLSGLVFSRRWVKSCAVVAGILTFMQMLVVSAVNTMIEPVVDRPLAVLFEQFLAGNFDHYDSYVRLYTSEQFELLIHWTKFNLGQAFGLNGLASLVPWCIAMLIMTGVVFRQARTAVTRK